MSVSLLKDKCNEIVRMGADSEEIVSFDACDELESINKIEVVDTKIDKGFVILFLDFYTESISQYQNIDNLIWELQYQIQSYMGKNTVKLVHNDTTHKKIDSNW